MEDRSIRVYQILEIGGYPKSLLCVGGECISNQATVTIPVEDPGFPQMGAPTAKNLLFSVRGQLAKGKSPEATHPPFFFGGGANI